jgi:glycosyltransferase involved in cell wall biosynthesis
LKVLAVINNLDTGGAERLLVKAAPKLVNYGITVDVLLLNGTEYPFLNELRKKKCCKIFSLGNHRVSNPLHIFKIMPHLRKYDVVHVHLFPALYWVALAKLLSFSKVPLVFTEHSTTNKRRKKMVYALVDKLIYSRYSVIVTISTEVKLYLKRHLGKTRNTFRTINNGVEVQAFQDAKIALRSDFNIPEDHSIIIHLARFTPQKDPATLVRAIPYLEHPTTVLFVGEGGERSKIEILVSELDLEQSVKFLGMRTDVPALLKLADIAVLSSNHEGLSLSSLEAMASGTPLIASNVTGLKNVVHGAGILFDHKDEIDLAEKINLLINNKKLYAEIVANGTKRVHKFELKSMVKSHIALYNEICANKN